MIELSRVSFSYPERSILRDVNLRIGRGEYLGVTGDNGSGKTTLVKLLNGLLLPHRGRVTVDGVSTSDRGRLLAIRRSVGIVFQNPDAQAVGETVEEDIVFGLENIRVPVSEIDRRIERYLGILGIGELRDRNTSLLSGGQKQLVNIAAVMAMEPECIVFDEALSMMDAGNRRNVLTVVSELNSRGTSIVQITHNPEELGNCHRVIAISDGRISPQGLVCGANETNEGKEGEEDWDGRGGCGEVGEVGEVRCRRTDPGSGVFRGGVGIEIRHLSHTYNSGTGWAVPALNDVSLKVRKGGITGIVGGIGSGKSTLACLIAGLDTPASGSIVIDGMPPEPGGKVRILFQHPEEFFFERTVRAAVAFGLSGDGLPADAVDARVLSAMGEVGLDRRILGESPFRISSGEQRLAAFACTAVTNPEYVIFDEPTAGLDRRSRGLVLDAIRRLAGGGVTVIYISHRIREVLGVAERIAVLSAGNLTFEGTRAMYRDRM